MKQLLELMLEHQELFEVGLCFWATNLYKYNLITYDELIILRKHIKKNKPVNAGRTFYWNYGEINPRIEWINQQIEKL